MDPPELIFVMCKPKKRADYTGGSDSSKDPDPSNSNSFGSGSGYGAGSSKNRIRNTSSFSICMIESFGLEKLSYSGYSGKKEEVNMKHGLVRET